MTITSTCHCQLHQPCPISRHSRPSPSLLRFRPRRQCFAVLSVTRLDRASKKRPKAPRMTTQRLQSMGVSIVAAITFPRSSFLSIVNMHPLLQCLSSSAHIPLTREINGAKCQRRRSLFNGEYLLLLVSSRNSSSLLRSLKVIKVRRCSLRL